ncbi:MAG: ABC transporter ATP-binding protein [Crocinitomicaceae bacterium]
MILSVDNIKVNYDKFSVLKGITFSVQKGERIVVVGESGCGKTTLLKTIAGYVQIRTGSIKIEEDSIKGPEEQLVPGHPKIKLVNQDFGLDNFHTVTENIRLRLLQFNQEYIDYRIATLLKVTGLEKYSKRLANDLSGGQKQRLAIARALADEPEVLLLDEPFNQLDYFLRQRIENYIDDYLRKHNITLLLVSHSGEETMRWGERVLFLNNGKLEREDTPTQFYENPKNRKQAGFFGVLNTVFVDGKYISFRPHEYAIRATNEFPIELKVDLEKVINKGWFYDHLLKYKKRSLNIYASEPINIKQSIYIKPLF